MTPAIEPVPHHLDVSDHAVVRWLERVCGVDVEKYREEIREAFLAGGLLLTVEHSGQDVGVYVDVPAHKVHLVVRNGQVSTVFHAGSEPD